MKKSKQIAFSGVLSALSIVLLFLGSVINLLVYVVPIFTGLLMIIIVTTINKRTAFLTYVVVSLLSILLLPDKECALTYIFFFGYYTIIKDKLDLIKPKFAQYLVKIVLFNATIIASQLILIYAFGVTLDNAFGKWGVPILLVLANAIFVAYEKLIGVVTKLYMKKYYNRIKKLLK